MGKLTINYQRVPHIQRVLICSDYEKPLIGMLKIACFHCTHQNSVEDAPATIPTSVFGGKSARTCSWALSFCCQQCQQCTFGHQKKITCSLNHRIAIVPYRTFVLRRRNGRSLAVIPRPKTETQKHRKLIIHDIGFRTLHAAVGWSRASLEISQPCPIGNIPSPNALQSSAGDASSMDVLLGPICSCQPWNSSSCDRILASRSHSAIHSWSEGQNGSNKRLILKYLPSILPLGCLEREKAKTRNHATMQGILC